ncbi:MAG: C10 family peptidase, partial [Mariniphaga sp.]|nr:C10 family peptidase [Mariniphaga sp.]
MKKLIPILLILVIPIISLGEKVNIRKAKKVAQRIYKLDKPDKDELKIENFITLGNNNDTLLYVFSYPDDGFVIISAEDAAPPVLGHCKKGKYEPENMPGGLLYLIEKYQYSISSLREKKSVASEKIKKQWINILNDDSQLKSYTIGTTLLSTSWGQEDGYNDECPNEWPAGCTAVAMAQILRRWGCQIDPSGSVNYQYGSISFGDYTYNWEDMNDGSPDDDNAQLIYHAGVSCLTNYGSNSSTSLPWKARNGFVDFWGIDSDADLKWRIWHLSNWQDMLEDEIDLERPILYSAASGSSGHSWVIDGYEQDGDFWCNWGWNGDFNGPFSLGFELPGDMGS